jgi:acyl dehydratase
MAKQVYYEDVKEGKEIPQLAKNPTTMQLVKWAGASGDYYQIHYDKDFAQAAGLPGVIVHGRLKSSFLGQLLSDWVGEGGWVKKIAVQHRGMDFPGEQLTCKGTVTKKYVQGGEHIVELEIWTENPRGEKTAPATATVVLPSRG